MLAAVLVPAWLAMALVIEEVPVVLRAPAGLLLVSLPGVVWLRAARSDSIPALERWTLVTALDLGLVVATAFVLNAAPGGLHAMSWAIAQASIITVGAIVRLVRVQTSTFGVVVAARRGGGRIPRLTIQQYVAIVIGTAALSAAGMVSVVSQRSSNDAHFTELSLTPCAPAARPTSAMLLITNHERSTMRYRLAFASGSTISRHAITLEAGDSYRRLVSLSGGAASATLNRPYRHVWVGDPQGSPRPGFPTSMSRIWTPTPNSKC